MSIYTNFLNSLSFKLSLLKSNEAEYGKILSNKFNVFQYIHSDENKVSDVIADLLNPLGNHGQQNLFLDKFLDMLEYVPENLKNIMPKIEREALTYKIQNNRRRIDLLIYWDNHFAIGIENKPWIWSKDEIKQLEDYSKHLDTKYQGNYLLVYLSQKEEPDTESISKEGLDKLKEAKKYKSISYNYGLDNWLRHCIEVCQSDKFRYFLKDFKSKITNNMAIEDSLVIVNHALSSEDNLEAAVETHFAFSAICEKIALNITEKVKKALIERYGSEIEITNDTKKDRINLWLRRKEWEKDTYCGFVDEDSDRLCLWVWTHEDEKTPMYKYIQKEYNGKIGGFAWWDYIDEPYYDWTESVEGIKAMNGDEAVNYFMKEFEILVGLVDNYYLSKNE